MTDPPDRHTQTTISDIPCLSPIRARRERAGRHAIPPPLCSFPVPLDPRTNRSQDDRSPPVMGASASSRSGSVPVAGRACRAVTRPGGRISAWPGYDRPNTARPGHPGTGRNAWPRYHPRARLHSLAVRSMSTRSARRCLSFHLVCAGPLAPSLPYPSPPGRSTPRTPSARTWPRSLTRPGDVSRRCDFSVQAPCPLRCQPCTYSCAAPAGRFALDAPRVRCRSHRRGPAVPYRSSFSLSQQWRSWSVSIRFRGPVAYPRRSACSRHT